MKNFKEIAEKCLAGELSGTFVTAFGNNWHSNYLQRYTILGQEIPEQYILGPGVIYNEIGQCKGREEVRIINFIPDNMQEQIKIDIPEGKVPVMEQTKNGVVITWKEKELTYYDVCNNLQKHNNLIGGCDNNSLSESFRNKMWTLRKLINIRNYFGGDKPTNLWVLTIDSALNVFPVLCSYRETNRIYFETREHAEQAIKMLGDELKYLFEPW